MYRQQRNSFQNSVETNGLIEKPNEPDEVSTPRYIIGSDSLSTTSSNNPRINSDSNNYNMMNKGGKRNTSASITPDPEQPLIESPCMLKLYFTFHNV
jgi:hypothetical protein